MNSEDMAILSFYEEKATVSDKSEVFLVQHRETGRFYIKKHLSIYDRELYTSLKDMNIPGIPRIYHIAEDGNRLIVIEEYINGAPLSSFISEHGPFSACDAADIISNLCDILSVLHSCTPPIIHRDIKTSNIIISSDMQVTLIDFNASKKFDSGKNYDTCLMGTAEYAAPEQFGFSQSDARTDIYALGILLNILITGCFPKDVLCSGSAARVVTKCTQMDPARRYSSVLQLKSALRYISDTPVKHLYPFLPPGFRTMTWWKIIIALIMYPLLATLCLSLDLKDCNSVPQLYTERALIGAWMIFTVALCCNYLNLADRFPLTRSRIQLVRLFGMALWSFAAFASAALISVAIFS